MSTEVVTVYDFTVQVGSDMFCEIRKFLACHGKRDIYKFIHGASTLESKTLKQGKRCRLREDGDRKDSGFLDQLTG